ncbi:MAG: site-specific integrase, partial [Phycisphaerae bacterium]|nr:site-specific integrase [Phycisphaerae bacterium]
MNESVNLCKTTIKKPNGTKYVYWVLRWRDTSGKHHGKNIGRTNKMSKRQAEKLRQAKALELFSQPGRRNVSGSPALGEYLDGYYEARKSELAPGTMKLHKQTGRYLKGFFGETRHLDSIQRPEARAFKTALANGELVKVNREKKKRKKLISPSTVNLNIRNARTIFNMAVEDDMILFNPFDRIAGKAPAPKDWHYVGLEEFGTLFEAAAPYWKLLFALARYAGLRRGEALNLRWDNIDWERSRLTVVSTEDWTVKDKDTRTVPVSPELAGILLEAFEEAAEGAETVIPADSINVKNLSRDFTVLCKRADVKRYSKPIHTLRKSCLTDWARRFPAHVVKEWAGHASFETTDAFYLKVSDAEYETAATQTFSVCTQLCA